MALGLRSLCKLCERVCKRVEDNPSVVAAQQLFARSFRVRHQAKHIAFAVADARDVVKRAVRVRFRSRVARSIRVSEDDAILSLKFGKRLSVAEVIAIAVRYRHRKNLPALAAIRKRRWQLLLRR